MFRKSLISATMAAGVALALSAAPGHAADVLGSSVDSSVFSAAIGSTNGWSFLGTSTSAFTGSGNGTIDLRSASFSDSFGYAKTNDTGLVQVFGAGASVGSTSAVVGLFAVLCVLLQCEHERLERRQHTVHRRHSHRRVLRFDARRDIDIFKNASTDTWAFFYDDGGPAGSGDDNDFNDMVVTFSQTPASVPEPGSLAILGMALIGAGLPGPPQGAFLSSRNRTRQLPLGGCRFPPDCAALRVSHCLNSLLSPYGRNHRADLSEYSTHI